MVRYTSRRMNMKIIAIGALLVAATAAVLAISSNRIELAAEDPHQHDHAQEATTFVSSDNEEISVVFAGDHLDLTGLGYEDLLLQQVEAASDARYENREANLVLWNKGEEVTIYRDEEVLFSGVHKEHGYEHGHEADELHEPESDVDVAISLQGKTWVWEKYQAADGSTVAPRQVDAFTLTFGDQSQISGRTDCNNFGGSFTLSGNELEFGPFMSTKMYCEGSQESEFLGYLGSGHLTVTMSGSELILKQEKEGGELHFVAK